MTTVAPRGISVILPALNEEENIERAVEHALEVLQDLSLDHEVIVVDDGSKDRTVDVVKELVRANHPRVRLLVHSENEGYGSALRTGFSNAAFSLIFFTDSDNQFDVAELAYFLPQMDDYDVLTGFRVYRYDSVVRSMMSWIYNRLVHVIFRVGVRDVDCAFKLFRREVIDQITIETNNFFVCTELLARARKWNFRIGEKGVRHYPRTAGETTVQASDIPRTLREIVRMWQRIYLPSRRQKEQQARAAESVVFSEFLPGQAS